MTPDRDDMASIICDNCIKNVLECVCRDGPCLNNPQLKIDWLTFKLAAQRSELERLEQKLNAASFVIASFQEPLASHKKALDTLERIAGAVEKSAAHSEELLRRLAPLPPEADPLKPRHGYTYSSPEVPPPEPPFVGAAPPGWPAGTPWPGYWPRVVPFPPARPAILDEPLPGVPLPPPGPAYHVPPASPPTRSAEGMDDLHLVFRRLASATKAFSPGPLEYFLVEYAGGWKALLKTSALCFDPVASTPGEALLALAEALAVAFPDAMTFGAQETNSPPFRPPSPYSQEEAQLEFYLAVQAVRRLCGPLSPTLPPDPSLN